MRFGTSAIVRVGRGPAPMPPSGRGPARGFAPAPPQVRVGRQAVQTHTGATGPNDGMGGHILSGESFPAGSQGPSLWNLPIGPVRQEPLGSTRALVLASATREFLFQPCSPFKLHYFTVPESFALLFTLLSLKICRDEMIEGECPCEAFSDQAGFMNNIVNGRYAYPSIPVKVLVRCDAAADTNWNGLFLGAVQNGGGNG